MAKQTLIVAVTLLIVLLTTALYFLYVRDSLSTQDQTVGRIDGSTQTNGKAGGSDIVAVFSEEPVLSTNQNAIPTPESNVAGASNANELKMSLPSEWKLLSTEVDEKSKCEGSTDQMVKVYQKEKETVTLYQNASPSGCENLIIGDVTIPFSFNEKGDITLQKSVTYTQCSKEQNSTCPKGDGKVTVFVTNYDKTTNNPRKNPLNNKTYAFRIDDTQLDSDFNQQVNDLLAIIEKISFSY